MSVPVAVFGQGWSRGSIASQGTAPWPLPSRTSAAGRLVTKPSVAVICRSASADKPRTPGSARNGTARYVIVRR